MLGLFGAKFNEKKTADATASIDNILSVILIIIDILFRLTSNLLIRHELCFGKRQNLYK